MLNELLKLHKLGFALLWLNKKSKVPVENNWTKRERKTFDQLKDSYKPGYNVGVRPGYVSKFPGKENFYLGIIDCDVKSEDPLHLAEMEKALESVFPEFIFSPTVVSGRNKHSRHVYVKVHELNLTPRYQIAESAHRIKYLAPSKKTITNQERAALTAEELEKGFRLAKAWELTFMGDDSQCVLPPSIHPDSGRPYEWAIEPKTVDDFVEFIPGKIRAAKISKAQALPVELKDDIEVYTLPVSDRVKELIHHAKDDGRYHNDRSAMIMACLNALVGARLDNELIVSVMTDPTNAIAEKALEKGDRRAAAKWILQQLAKVKDELNPANDFDDGGEVIDMISEDEAEAQDDAAVDWRQQLDVAKNNKRLNTQKNRSMILTRDLAPNTVRYNEFSNVVEYHAEPPWGITGKNYVGEEMGNVDITAIRDWFSRKWKIEVSSGDVWESVLFVASRYSYHPVRDYLNSLVWDKKPRLNNWLIDYLNAEGDEKYIRAIGAKTLVAAVARVFKPGVKFDTMLVLEGGQGVGKSSAISILGGPKWTSDAHIDPNNKDTINNIQGKWLIEMAEMVPAHKSEAESLKAFLSKTEDRARLAFERKAVTYPRQCVFIGSTNQDEYLQDETGNRRFWPVVVGELERDSLINDRDQLWAEAVARYKLGEPLWLDDDEVRATAKYEQASRLFSDEWAGDVQRYIETHPQEEFLNPKKVWMFICNMEADFSGAGRFTLADQKRLGKIFKLMGLERVSRRDEGQVRKLWKFPTGKKDEDW